MFHKNGISIIILNPSGIDKEVEALFLYKDGSIRYKSLHHLDDADWERYDWKIYP